jgi:polar amino acid transport system ATP-binding protein
LAHLDIRELRCGYAGQTVLDGVSLGVERGEVVSLIGPSGSGKSTLLRALIGLTPPQSGEVHMGGVSVDYHDRRSLRKLRSQMAIVFQQYNLFRNMSVLRNVMIAPIQVQKRPPDSVRALASELLARVGMADKHTAYPDQLSGGQQQRVAIARALALQPAILLLDEVTSALDPERVTEVLDTVRALTHQGMTLLIVSHEMAFVREVSDRVVMMDAGRIVESGPPEQIFDHPAQARTREFVSKILRH